VKLISNRHQTQQELTKSNKYDMRAQDRFMNVE
jgi:hypothetical protein